MSSKVATVESYGCPFPTPSPFPGPAFSATTFRGLEHVFFTNVKNSSMTTSPLRVGGARTQNPDPGLKGLMAITRGSMLSQTGCLRTENLPSSELRPISLVILRSLGSPLKKTCSLHRKYRALYAVGANSCLHESEIDWENFSAKTRMKDLRSSLSARRLGLPPSLLILF